MPPHIDARIQIEVIERGLEDVATNVIEKHIPFIVCSAPIRSVTLALIIDYTVKPGSISQPLHLFATRDTNHSAAFQFSDLLLSRRQLRLIPVRCHPLWVGQYPVSQSRRLRDAQY